MYRTNFGPFIAAHWRENYPDKADQMERDGTLESTADRRADRSGESLSIGLRNGLKADAAFNLASQFWSSPYEM